MKVNMLNLKLHEELRVGHTIYVTRVNGGFIYRHDGYNGNSSTTFVPLSEDPIGYDVEEYKD